MLVKYAGAEFEIKDDMHPRAIMKALFDVFPELEHSGYYYMDEGVMYVECKSIEKLANMQRALKNTNGATLRLLKQELII